MTPASRPPRDGSGPAASAAGYHHPVLLDAVLAALRPAAGEIFIDGTFGRGGYTRALLAAAACRVEGIDCDPEAVAAGRALERECPGRFVMHQGRFGDMDRLVPEPADGVALDLGVSSPQIDDPARGFSFRADGPLDMRMAADGATAADIVNRLPEAELARIIFELGEERLSRRIARAIITTRETAPLTRTEELAALVRRVVPRARDGIDPATRTFQALRLYVNDELGQLDHGLSAAERCLRPGGKLAVVSFHSLEDRRVKRFLTERSSHSGSGQGVSRHRPIANIPARTTPTFLVARRRPVTPAATEIAANPRARSARLRSAVRTDAPAWASAPNAIRDGGEQ